MDVGYIVGVSGDLHDHWLERNGFYWELKGRRVFGRPIHVDAENMVISSNLCSIFTGGIAFRVWC